MPRVSFRPLSSMEPSTEVTVETPWMMAPWMLVAWLLVAGLGCHCWCLCSGCRACLRWWWTPTVTLQIRDRRQEGQELALNWLDHGSWEDWSGPRQNQRAGTLRTLVRRRRWRARRRIAVWDLEQRRKLKTRGHGSRGGCRGGESARFSRRREWGREGRMG